MIKPILARAGALETLPELPEPLPRAGFGRVEPTELHPPLPTGPETLPRATPQRITAKNRLLPETASPERIGPERQLPPYNGPTRVIERGPARLPGMVQTRVRGLLPERGANEAGPGAVPIITGQRLALPPGVAVGTGEPPTGGIRTMGGRVLDDRGNIVESLPPEAGREELLPRAEAPNAEARTKSEAEVRLERRIADLNDRLGLAKSENRVKTLTREKRDLESQLDEARQRGRKYSVEASYPADVAQAAKEQMVEALNLWEQMPEPGRSFYEGESLEDRLPSRIAQKEGWSGQGSPKGIVRDAFPWLDPRTMGADYNLSDLRDALRRGKGQVYDRFLEAAAEYVKAQREAGNPLMREPGEEEPPF